MRNAKEELQTNIMSESIKKLIECERRAKERLDEALKARESIQAQAQCDADSYIRGYIAQMEAELEALEEDNKEYTVKLSKSLEDQYLSFIREVESRPTGELVALIAEQITLQPQSERAQEDTALHFE